MKYYSGTYGKETIASNSLVVNQLKFPEIASKIIRQYPQYSLAYMIDGLGRYAKEEMIGDVKFQWAVQGRLSRPSTLTGTFTGTGALATNFTFEVEENYLNPNDVVRFADGSQAIIIGEPTVSAGGYLYSARPNTGDVAFPGISVASFSAGLTIGKIGTAFTEGSDRGFQNHVYPDWYSNYLGIQRKAFEITGSALTDVTWIENNGSRLWYFTDEQNQREEFSYEMEKLDWYGKSTINPLTGVSTVLDMNGKPVIMGDGMLAQISTANIDTYNGILTEAQITDFMAQLQLNTGNKNQEWVVYTGTAGKVAFVRAMKEYLVSGAARLMYNAQTGKMQELGADFNVYYTLGHKITLAWAPVFDDPQIHTDIDPVSGFPKESFRMVFCNFGTTNGVSNIERKVKGAGGINRSMVTRYIAGMANVMNNDQLMAATAADKFSVEWLRESMLVIRNDKSCGQLIFA